MNSTNDAVEQVTLYEKWRKIYPLSLYGGWQRWRRVVLSFLVGIYYAGPWLRLDGDPMFWFNLPERKFVFFGVTFFPQEFVLLSWILMMAAFLLFTVTVLAGRVFCGWACPQTVWTLVYFFIEQKVEGERNQRLRLDRGPWNRNRIVRKGIKYILWAGVAFSISFTFVAYFDTPQVLIERILTLSLAGWEWFWLLFLAGASFLFSGVLREQVCFHMCPYARFQSVMFDRDTLIISYDENRGEPRGHRPRRHLEDSPRGGDCVDCKLCVHACPTGIDIRDGLQYQCIACAACIDACNGIMEQLGQAPNLIRYSSQHRDKGEEVTWKRPRLFGYAAVLMAICSGFVFMLTNRVPLELDIIRDRGRLYREHWDGSVENTYQLKIINREETVRQYTLTAEADFPFELKTRKGELVEVQPGKQLTMIADLVAMTDPEQPANRPVHFIVETVGEPHFIVREPSRFLQPSEPRE